MRKFPRRIKVQVWPFKRSVSVRAPVVVLHSMPIRLRSPAPGLAVGTVKMGADNRRSTVFILIVTIRVVDYVPGTRCKDGMAVTLLGPVTNFLQANARTINRKSFTVGSNTISKAASITHQLPRLSTHMNGSSLR